MAATSESEDLRQIIVDTEHNKSYKWINFLGKGNFGMYFAFSDVETNHKYAAKAIPKKAITTHKEDGILSNEIVIYRDLQHKNIVKFHECFHDKTMLYMTLELCENSMNDLFHKRRTITTYECCYYLRQILAGVKYLHGKNIIHRDITLPNLLLNQKLQVKIADFGYATRAEYEHVSLEKIGDTLKYTAPETLAKMKPSLAMDIWAIGCVMYALLVGTFPFDGVTDLGIRQNIMRGKYIVPMTMQKNAGEMVRAMLQIDPEKRPTTHQLLNFDFLKATKVPKSFPNWCLTRAPMIPNGNLDSVVFDASRKPLTEVNEMKDGAKLEMPSLKKYKEQEKQGAVRVQVRNLKKGSRDNLENHPAAANK